MTNREGSAGEPEEPPYPTAAVRAALVGVALSGFTAMLYEITWIRLLTLVLGASTYAFTLILTAFIGGIGLGSYWVTRRARSADELRRFGWLQLALLVSVCLALPLYVRLPYYFWQAHHAINRSLGTWPLYQALTFSFCCAVLLVPTFFMGAAFPTIARVAIGSVERLGRQLGRVYLCNTIGTVLGASLGGLVLMPLLGMELSFAIGIIFNLLAAAIAFRFAPEGGGLRRRVAPVAGALAISIAYLASTWGWSTLVGGAGTFRASGVPPESFQTYRAVMAEQVDFHFHVDDTFATVMVGEIKADHRLFLQINGKVDASTGGDTETQILLGQLGALLHPRAVKRVLVVGAGSGMTVGSVLTHPVEKVDLVEISPAVIEAAKLFHVHNHDALTDRRVQVHLEDARTFMALGAERYDLIISEPSNPWVAGVSGLFTREFFRDVEEHLEPDGLLVQWIHTYESSEELVRLVLRTIRDTFPHSTTWVGPKDLLIVASRLPIAPSVEQLAGKLARPEVAADLARVHIVGPFGVLAKQIHSDEGQAGFAGEGPINTEDKNLLEYAAPLAFFLTGPTALVRDERRAPDGGRRLLLASYLAQHPINAAQARELHQNLTLTHSPADPLVRSAAERWLALEQDNVDAQLALATAALAQEDLATAERLVIPRVEQGERGPAWVRAYLEVKGQQAQEHRSVWTGWDLQLGLQLGSERLRAAPADRELRRAFASLCRATAAPACAAATAEAERPVGEPGAGR